MASSSRPSGSANLILLVPSAPTVEPPSPVEADEPISPDSFSNDDFELDEEDVHNIACNWDSTLVGFIIEGKPFRKQAVTEGLLAAWNPRYKVDVSPLAERKFFFHFHHAMDMNNVLQEGPWNVGGNLLLLEKWNMNQEWKFTTCEFWVQLHLIPMELRSKEILTGLLRKIGDLRTMMVIHGMQFGVRVDYIQARVLINITKPIRNVINIKRKQGKVSIVSVRYEKLPLGASRGLAILWQHNVDIKILNSDDWVIEAEVLHNQGSRFKPSCVYGDPVRSKRQQVWDKLIQRNAGCQDPWLYIGDFNSFLGWHEKCGGNRTNDRDADNFRNLIDQCNLMDLGSHGPRYTWNNRRAGNANIRIKLDHALANPEWGMLFEDAVVFVKAALKSDHNPLLVDTNGGKSNGPRPFRFEAAWDWHPGCKDVVQQAWSNPIRESSVSNVSQRSSHCQYALTKWNHEVFGRIQVNIKKLKYDLERLQDLSAVSFCQGEVDKVSKLLEEELLREETLWHQKAREEWLKCGDKNSGFFHALTVQRRHQNQILKLRSGSGEWLSNDKDTCSELLNHFKEVATSTGVSSEAIERALQSTQPLVSRQWNEDLCRIPSREEVKAAISSMSPLKLPGPDGFPTLFYQKFMDTTQEAVYQFVTGFFVTGVIPKEMNNTLICLIPKVPSPERAEQFRPISLCNIAIKVLSSLFAEAERNKLIKGVRVRGRAPPISHLHFADDCLIFSEVKLQEINHLKDCLDTYCQASGQEIDFSKSNLTFSPNTPTKFKRWFSRILKVRYGNGPSKYLGLPPEIGVSKAEVFKDITSRMCQRVQGWKQSMLSQAGHEVLIKSVASTISSYAGSHFILPASHHDSTRSKMSNFFWGQKEDKRTLHWISWTRLCRSEEKGGLGFKDPTLHNRVLLAKVAWRLLDNPDSLWAKFTKAIYFPRCNFLDASVGRNPSWAWRSILEGRKVIDLGQLWSIGNGNKRDQQFSTRATSSHRHAWEDIPSEVWKRIWNIKTLPKVKNFLWICCANGIASGENFMKRHIPIDPSCTRCGHNPESVNHLLFLCPRARAAWFGSNLTVGIPANGPFTLAQLLLHWPSLNFHDKRYSEDLMCLLSFICWNIWLARNDLVFCIKGWTPEDIISRAQASSTEFLSNTRGNISSERNAHVAHSFSRQWSPSDSGIIKINCDAAFSLKAPASGIGVVLRDHLGNLIQVASNPILFHEVLLGEALAVLFGLQLASSGVFAKIYIESDNEDLISLIRDPSRPHPLFLRSTL
ncbi:uncharacterized protein LOC122653966 [Telopea speciosissima]|uniref:uncharacterized protein LOC122653966 n=1 Tax=Telopea speciosissima TaxID=54955 RepID=UPI001CC5592C|nr:uncharacterized protein LOC122653966 [Telopea speciosissima]